MDFLKLEGIKRPLGPIMIDITSDRLTREERDILSHPAVGGVILFTRNYENPAQIRDICVQLHKLRTPELLVAVDHEGGRVQRFRDGFTSIPAMRKLGELYDEDPETALDDAHTLGWLLAAELRACQLDFSFAPVLDLDYKKSEIIGNRAFHSSPQIVTKLASSFFDGLKDAGMAAVGKHFPGHGYVTVDSHLDLPVDDRDLKTLEKTDMLPFQYLFREGMQGVMPAHVVFPKIDSRPVGFSAFWLREVLRKQMGFSGVIISDDLSMKATNSFGTPLSRTEAALDAGCDAVLICNDRDAALQVLDFLPASLMDMPKVSLSLLRPAFNVLWDMKELQDRDDHAYATTIAEKITDFEKPKKRTV